MPHFDFPGIREGFQARSSDAIPAGITSVEDLFWDCSRVTVPCFHAGGWYDMYSGLIFTSFAMMKEKGGSAAARGGQHVFCGPWAHGGQLPSFVGGLHFGPTANAAGSFSQARRPRTTSVSSHDQTRLARTGVHKRGAEGLLTKGGRPRGQLPTLIVPSILSWMRHLNS